MSVTCPQCGESFEAARPQLKAPPFLAVQRHGVRICFSWWEHGLAWDLRVLALLVLGILAYLASLLMPAAGISATVRAFWMAPGGLWERDWISFLNILGVGTVAVALGYLVVRVLCNRQTVEWDGYKLRTSIGPLRGASQEVSGRLITQLYVAPDGSLRCIDNQRQHQVLARGARELLRYVEQELEARMQITDVPVDDEWLPPTAPVEVRRCPHCDFDLRAERVGDLSNPEGALHLSLAWWNTEMIGLVIWCCGWDTFCCMFVLGGLGHVLRGDLSGLGVFLIPHVWIGVLVTYYVLCRLLNRTDISCDGRRLLITCAPIRFPGFPREFSCSQLRQLYVVENPNNKPVTYSLEAQTTEGKTVTLVRGQSNPGDLRALEQQIEKYLHIDNKRVPGEWSS